MGKKIIVDLKSNTLTLIGKAALQQGQDTARGDTIVYNMETDTLRVQGGGVAGGGKEGAAKPKRTLEDPFKDNAQGPDEPGKSNTSATNSANETASESTGTQSTPTSSGRSRLILRPKPIEKDETTETEAQNKKKKKKKENQDQEEQ